jgi:hypothetical protein
LARSPCPVAIGPHGYSDRTVPITLVACAYDATPDARRALRVAAQFAQRLRTRVLVMRVVEAADAIEATRATEPAAAAAIRRIHDQVDAETHRAAAELDASLDAEAIVLR